MLMAKLSTVSGLEAARHTAYTVNAILRALQYLVACTATTIVVSWCVAMTSTLEWTICGRNE
jgi:hypothetical protein